MFSGTDILIHFVQWVYKSAAEHEGVISLLLLAFIITMRPKLPPPFCEWGPMEWIYEWGHDALKAFVSFRSPSNAPSEQKAERLVDDKAEPIASDRDKNPPSA